MHTYILLGDVTDTKYKNTFLLYVKYIAYTTGLLPPSQLTQTHNRRKLFKMKKALHQDGEIKLYTISNIIDSICSVF